MESSSPAWSQTATSVSSGSGLAPCSAQNGTNQTPWSRQWFHFSVAKTSLWRIGGEQIKDWSDYWIILNNPHWFHLPIELKINQLFFFLSWRVFAKWFQHTRNILLSHLFINIDQSTTTFLSCHVLFLCLGSYRISCSFTISLTTTTSSGDTETNSQASRGMSPRVKVKRLPWWRHSW